MITAAQAQVVAALTAAGIRATTDERDVNPPCVFVPAPALVPRFGGQCWDATYTLIATVPDAGRPTALAELGAMVAAVNDALGGVLDANPVSFAGVDGAPPLPGYAIRYSQSIE